MKTLFLFGIFVLLLLLSVPAGYAIGISGILSILLFSDMPILSIGMYTLDGCDSFSLLAVPFFILAGNLMTTGGIAKRIVNFANACLGHITGGLSIVTTAACMFYAAISGSAFATTGAVGSFMMPAMEEKGYDKGFSGAISAAAGSIGVIIPPSIPFVLYGCAVGASVGSLFKAGLIPGIMMGIALMVVCYIESKKNGWRGTDRKSTAKEIWVAFKDSFWALMMPVIILGGIYTGAFTPTEAAVISVVYCVIISVFIYKEMKWKELLEAFTSTIQLCGVSLFMMGFCNTFSIYMTMAQIPQAMTKAVMGITSNPILLLLVINIFLLIVGCFIDNIPATMILSPILLPIVREIGMSPIQFGVLLTMNLAIGFITPPYGMNLYMAAMVGKMPIGTMIKPTLKFLAALLVVLMLITYVPWFSMAFV